MKNVKLWKILFTDKSKQKQQFIQKKLFYNNTELLNFYVTFFREPRKMYKIIRNIRVTKEPNVFYARNQKAFNTYLFVSKYDILITDKSGKILDIKKECQSNYVSPHYKHGWYVFFFPIGSVNYYKFEKNNLLTPGIMILKDLKHISRF